MMVENMMDMIESNTARCHVPTLNAAPCFLLSFSGSVFTPTMLSGLLAHALRFYPKNTTISSRVPLQWNRVSRQLLHLRRQTTPSRAPIPTTLRTRQYTYFSRFFSYSPTVPTTSPTGKSVLKQALPLRFFSSNGSAHWEPDAQLPVLSTPAVANWLFLCSTLVFGVIVVGGVTRLTYSGLSITEWRPFTVVLRTLS